MAKPAAQHCMLHDNNALALALADQLPAAALHLLDATPALDAPADLVIVHAAGERWPLLVAAQQRAREQSLTTLFVTVEPDSVWIGPLVRPAAATCFHCLKSWLANNHRDGYRWYNQAQPTVRKVSTAPLAPAAILAYQTLMAHLLEQLAAGDSAGLDAAVWRLDLESLCSRRHRLLPWSGCPSCPALPDDSAELAELTLQPRLKAHADADRQDNPLLDLPAIREHFVDRRTGLVPHVFHDLSSRLMPMFAAEMPIADSDTIEVGYGRSETRQGSEMVAVLETLERYAGHAPRGKRTTVRACYAELGDQAIDPRSFILHAPEQAAEPGYALHRYDDHLVFDWVWGYSFRRQQPVLVPEQLVYYWLPARPGRPANRFVFDTSSGCALGGSLEESTLYGLFEVLERDAYLTTWYNRQPPVEVDLDSIAHEPIQALRARTQSEGFELHVYDIRHDIDVPVFWAMIVDPRPDAPVKSYCAAGAHLRPERAIYSALVEVSTSMGVYQRSLPALRDKAQAMLDDGSRVQAMSDHVLLYSLPETYPRLQFLHQGPGASLASLHPQRPRQQDLTAELREQIDKVLAVAEDVIVVDQGFEQLAEHGLSCAKVLVPGLLPMTFGHQYRRVSLARLDKAARHAQAKPVMSLADINPFPHNFP
ncbi:TOMM precursor leader peptide-binding protein [Chitinimonas sp.]|uniref:TOMM precursor leader peptide-binding protein n=1 Tax=Chitinimonas sp. TaxID=1934313 RepID=UPI0035B06EAF